MINAKSFGNLPANDSKLLSLTPPPELASCFAKLRLAAELLPEFALEVDKQAKIGRLESIKAVFEGMVEMVFRSLQHF